MVLYMPEGLRSPRFLGQCMGDGKEKNYNKLQGQQ